MQEEEARLLKEHEEQLLKDLKEAVRAEKEGRKMPRQTKPAIILENREPPEIPEFKIEPPVASPFTGDDAILYMFRLSLFTRMRKQLEEDARKAAAEKREREERGDSYDKHSVRAGKDESSRGSDGGRSKREGADLNTVGEDTLNDPSLSVGADKDDSLQKRGADDGKIASKSSGTKKSKSKSKKKSKKSSPPKPTVDNRQSFERDPEIDKILHEVVETLNRNQTPVQRKLPSRVVPRNNEPIREENIRIHKNPNARPWPKLEECIDNPQPRFLVFTSTWLSVTAKGVE